MRFPDRFIELLEDAGRRSVVEHGEFCTVAASPAPFTQERDSPLDGTARPALCSRSATGGKGL
jgi:hypothetical protein